MNCPIYFWHKNWSKPLEKNLAIYNYNIQYAITNARPLAQVLHHLERMLLKHSHTCAKYMWFKHAFAGDIGCGNAMQFGSEQFVSHPSLDLPWWVPWHFLMPASRVRAALLSEAGLTLFKNVFWVVHSRITSILPTTKVPSHFLETLQALHNVIPACVLPLCVHGKWLRSCPNSSWPHGL